MFVVRQKKNLVQNVKNVQKEKIMKFVPEEEKQKEPEIKREPELVNVTTIIRDSFVINAKTRIFI